MLVWQCFVSGNAMSPIACWVAHTSFKYPGGGGGSQCARWVGTHQHPAIPNFDLKIEGRPIDFETGHFETQFLNCLEKA